VELETRDHGYPMGLLEAVDGETAVELGSPRRSRMKPRVKGERKCQVSMLSIKFKNAYEA
jgi:hypothetical protein